MKPYDLVIQDSLEELITVTNIAAQLGYEPVGGIQKVEEKFIQTIYLNRDNMSSFIKAIATLLQDRQDLNIAALKVGDDLVVTFTPGKKMKGKVHQVTIPLNGGTPGSDDLNDPELDSKLIGSLSLGKSEPATFKHEQLENTDVKTATTPSKATSKPASAKKAEPKKSAPAKKAVAKKAAPKKSTAKTKTVEQPAEAIAAESEVAEETTAELQPRTLEPEEKLEEGPTPEGAITEAIDSPAVEESNENQKLFEHFMADGKKLFAEKKYDDAVTAFTQAQELQPEDKAVAQALKTAQQWAKAVAAIKK